MRKVVVFLTIFVLLTVASIGQAIAAPDGPSLNWGNQVNSTCPAGNLVINVTQKVINDVDSGVAGNNWAHDNYNRQIQVWQIGENEFCASVQYIGSFVTIEGISPSGNSTVAEGIKGTMQGGYAATIIGTLNSDPAWQTKGNVGTIDYAGGPVSWLGIYFSSVGSFDYEYWGWIYRAGNNGTWVNSQNGNQGDISGS